MTNGPFMSYSLADDIIGNPNGISIPVRYFETITFELQTSDVICLHNENHMLKRSSCVRTDYDSYALPSRSQVRLIGVRYPCTWTLGGIPMCCKCYDVDVSY